MNAAPRFLIAFLSVLCDLCGKKSLRGLWRKMADFVAVNIMDIPQKLTGLRRPAFSRIMSIQSIQCEVVCNARFCAGQ